jgi:outer membrane biosynthesis protein TonB
MQINATDVVELVEVSAPGFKTTRYWLTFDRPTYLKAHLVKGSGLVEATEEETLAALGEVIMVSSKAPAVAAAAVPAAPMPGAAPMSVVKPAEKTIERRTPAAEPAAEPEVALSPRKIGRAAADEQPAAAEQPTTAETAAAGSEPVEPAQDVANEPAKVADAPKADAPKADSANDAAKADIPEAPTVDIARPVLDRATVSSVISTHRPEVIKCFAEGKKKNPAMKGTLSLSLQVNATGTVSRVQVQSTLNNPIVAACVAKAANTWKFPARNGGEMATVAYPFTIN